MTHYGNLKTKNAVSLCPVLQLFLINDIVLTGYIRGTNQAGSVSKEEGARLWQ